MKKDYHVPKTKITIKEQTEQAIADSHWEDWREFEAYYQAVISQLEEGEK